MALTNDGLTIKRFDEIYKELNAGLKVLLGSSVDTAENSLIGHLHSNISLVFSELYELSQAVFDAGDMRVAEGAALDNLVLNAGVIRKQAIQTQGYEYFTGLNGVVIPAGSRIGSAKGDEFYTKDAFTITSKRCLQTRIYVGSIVANTDYTVVMQNAGYPVDSGATPTEESILNLLSTALDGGGVSTQTVVVDPDTAANTYLLVDKDDKSSELDISGISYLKFDHVVTQFTVYSKEYGAISGDADAVSEVLTSVTDWYSVTNPVDLTVGSPIEADNDLRLRAIAEFNAAGNGTLDSIVTSVLRLNGVKNCIVKENATSTTDAAGVPPKSYEVVVNGGVSSEIAQVVWDTKPAGIYAHGTTTVQIKDFNGYTQNIRYTNAIPKYMTVRVKYTPYTEESLPTEAIDVAKAAILKFASDTLTMDNDIIAKRFLGVIYASTTGFGDITIEVAGKDNPTDTVINGDYVDAFVISDTEFGSFSTNRLVFEVK